jgi:hypothetical protein
MKQKRMLFRSRTVSVSATSSISLSSILPYYDVELRELSVTGEVILRLPVQARSLAAVLAALQAAGWASRVPKPLSGRPGGNDPHHLAIAAYKLNDRQDLIDFHADDGALRWNWRPQHRERYVRSAPTSKPTVSTIRSRER